MDFVAIRDGEPICRLSGCSDVIHIDGIGGKMYGFGKILLPEGYTPIDNDSWSIDCLPKSGLLRLFGRGQLTCGWATGSFDIYSIEKR